MPGRKKKEDPESQLGFDVGSSEDPTPPAQPKPVSSYIPLGKELLEEAEASDDLAERMTELVDPSVKFDVTQEDALFDAPRDPTVMAASGLDEYKVPPFSILDTRQGAWQDRRRAWLRFNLQSEIGRDEKLTYGKFDQGHKERIEEEWTNLSPEEKAARGKEFTKAKFLKDHTRNKYGEGSTSIFDPVLCEVMYHWFATPGGVVLDPFAGGSVRGIIASCLGHPYIGIELRGIQVEANRQQAKIILRPENLSAVAPTPTWIEGDSDAILRDDLDFPKVDFIFTCPPYADLEVYSKDPADLSNMKADEFDAAYTRILGRSVDRLNDDRFAAIAISNIRDKAGHVRDLEALTCQAMESAGAFLYGEAVLINVVGTAPIRAKKQFQVSRKLTRVHQMVQVFVKGDPRKAAALIEPTSQ